MEIEIEKKEIVDSLNWTNKILYNKQNIPNFSSVKIKTKNNKICFHTRNLEAFAFSEKEAIIKKEGEFITTGRILQEIVKILPEEKIKIEKKENKIILTTKKTKHTIQNIEADIEEKKLENFEKIAQINVNELNRLLTQTQVAVAKEENLPMLTNINFEIKENQLKTTTIDRYRIARKKIEVNNFYKKNFEAPIKHKNITNALSGVEEKTIELYYNEKNNQIGFATKNNQISYSLITGEFPKTEQLFKEKYKKTITIEKKKFLEALNRTSIFTDASLGATFSFEKNKISITNDAENISSAEDLECEYEGENFTIKFNSNYIREGISQIDEEFILCKIEEKNQPVEFVGYNKEKKEENQNFTYIVVPIREM